MDFREKIAEIKMILQDPNFQLEETEETRGLGDVVARLTKAVGIPECGGCKKRRAILNTMVTFERLRRKKDKERK